MNILVRTFFQVVLDEFDSHSLNIRVDIFLEVPDRKTELTQRQKIFLEILKLAEIEDIKIGFPAGMLDIKSMSKNTDVKLQ